MGKKKTYGKILGSLQGTIILKAQEEKIFLGKIKRYFWERFNIETRKKVKTKNWFALPIWYKEAEIHSERIVMIRETV